MSGEDVLRGHPRCRRGFTHRDWRRHQVQAERGSPPRRQRSAPFLDTVRTIKTGLRARRLPSAQTTFRRVRTHAWDPAWSSARSARGSARRTKSGPLVKAGPGLIPPGRHTAILMLRFACIELAGSGRGHAQPRRRRSVDLKPRPARSCPRQSRSRVFCGKPLAVARPARRKARPGHLRHPAPHRRHFDVRLSGC